MDSKRTMTQLRRWLTITSCRLECQYQASPEAGNPYHQDGSPPKIVKNGTNPRRLVEVIGAAGGSIWGLCQLDDE